MVIPFVLGLNEALAFNLVGGIEGDLFAGVRILAIVNAPTPAKQTVTRLHFRLHVLSMNPIADTALASSG
jgi:hypothetical protein